MHNCPGPGCDAQVPYWYQVPRPLRIAVYRAWADGAGAGSAEHVAAMDAAVARMRPLASRTD